MDRKEVIEFVVERCIRETGSGKVFEHKLNKCGKSNVRNDEMEQQQGSGVDRLQGRKSQICRHYIQRKP